MQPNDQRDALCDDITFIPTSDLPYAAEITMHNMRGYYAQFAPDWDAKKILEVTAELDNIDICCRQEVVGIMRLYFDDSVCVLRDLQVIPSAQNRGIGQLALQEAKRRARKANLKTLMLRVFKVSAAVAFYERNGFTKRSEDERFVTMVVNCD